MYFNKTKQILIRLGRAYRDLGKEAFGLANSRQYLKLNLPMIMIFAIPPAIGILRTALETAFGIKLQYKWYVMDADILFVMAAFPLYFCFFGSFSIHGLGRLMKIKINYRRLFSLIFYMQILHLLVPPIDFLGLQLGAPYFYCPGKQYLGPVFAKGLIMTLGIITIWLASAWILFRVLLVNQGLPKFKSTLLFFAAFNLLYWPIYHFWPLFNTSYLLLAGGGPAADAYLYSFWGYGWFFLFSAFTGWLYYRKNI